MANIRVDLDYMLQDGADVAFNAPCDCSEVTGLIIYYPQLDGTTTSNTFTFRDAHKNDLGSLAELFVSGARVKVNVDIANGFAYIQNADTNAYLEAQLAGKMPKVTVVTTTGTDLDDYTEEGVYFFQSSTYAPTNIPEGSNGWLEVLTGNGFIKQIWHRLGTPGSNDHRSQVRTYSSVTEAWGAWTRYLTTKDASVSVVSNSYHYAYLAKIGTLVICTLLPKALTSTTLYSETLTIPSAYRPAEAKTFTYWSDTAKNAGDSAGKATISVATGGTMTTAATYGFTIAEASKTICWITA